MQTHWFGHLDKSGRGVVDSHHGLVHHSLVSV